MSSIPNRVRKAFGRQPMYAANGLPNKPPARESKHISFHLIDLILSYKMVLSRAMISLSPFAPHEQKSYVVLRDEFFLAIYSVADAEQN
jgi:hypothetical protein